MHFTINMKKIETSKRIKGTKNYRIIEIKSNFRKTTYKHYCNRQR